MIEAVGPLQSSLSSGCAAIEDWVLRARDLGFMAKRTNRVYVQRPDRAPSNNGSVARCDRDRAALKIRHPQSERRIDGFSASLDGRLPSHAVRIESTGKLGVALDIRHLPREQVGTRTYAIGLARDLAQLPEVELTLLVRDPAQARGLAGRVVLEDRWPDDVVVIHKPSQVIDSTELKLLFESSAHLVLTYQDLIGYRIPMVFPTDEGFDHYRATSSLTLQAVQHILAYSNSAASEITAEFGIPAEDVSVVPLGVDAEWFVQQDERDLAICRRLGLPSHFFFSLATDFPHKNLSNLLDAYAMLRHRWPDQDPPGLVLAGYTSSARTGFYPGLESKPLGEGLTFLGPVSSRELRVLYQQTLALVFPSLYEGFGLPPLEAMACGTPVIAMRVSSVPEVGGDCVLYPDGLSAASLARAMELLATDPVLREDLHARGLKRVEQFRWEQTARATLDVYRRTVLRPSERSLQMRRLLRDAIIRWSEPDTFALSAQNEAAAWKLLNQSIGIRRAWRALNIAVGARLKRELKRIQIPPRRRTA
jgi:glycosyltransferase involved in cell wall biosynthesis